jgi:uncharacterized repeat protein (TIGR02543 family)
MTGSTFVGWSGAYSGTNNPCTVIITEKKSITATFSRVYTQEELDAAVASERAKWDANNDGKIGLEEAVNALQITSGLED